MDVQLAKTFLAVTRSGSFVAAAEKLFVTQSAVSLRVKKLEELLGRTVFERSKAGVVLTPAGRQIERFAVASLRIWEEARHLVAVPEQYERTLLIGASPSLLPRMAMRLVSRLEQRLPTTAFRIDSGSPQHLVQLLLEGSLDVAITYRPELRPGLQVTELFDEELVLVAVDEDFTTELDERYVFMNWGTEFSAHHSTAFPEREFPRTSFSIGALALDFVLRNGKAGYFPARVVRDHIEAGELHLVANAPSFSYPCYAITHADLDEELRSIILKELARLSRLWDTLQEEILDDLEEISESPIEISTAGEIQ